MAENNNENEVKVLLEETKNEEKAEIQENLDLRKHINEHQILGVGEGETDPIYTADKDDIVFVGDNISLLNNDAGYITEVDWGEITGNIENQTDLVDYIEEAVSSVTNQKTFTAQHIILDKSTVMLDSSGNAWQNPSLSVGSPTTPSTNPTYDAGSVKLIKLDNDRHLYLIRRASDSILYGQVRTINANENDFYNGSVATIRTNVSTYIDACLIDTDKVLVIYKVNSSYIYGKVLTISTDTITVGSEYTIDDTSTSLEYIAVERVETNKVIMCYTFNDVTRYLYARILTISGTIITPQTRYTIESSSTLVYSLFPDNLDLIDTNKVIFVYHADASGSYTLKARILTISDNSISAGNATTIKTGSVNIKASTVKTITSTRCFIAYFVQEVYPNSHYMSSHILTISGTTISVGSAYTVTVDSVVQWVYNVEIIGTRYALGTYFPSAGTIRIYLFYIGGNVPSLDTYTQFSDTYLTGDFHNVLKIKPFLYYFICGRFDGYYSNKNRLFYLLPSSDYYRIGVAMNSANANESIEVLMKKNIATGYSGLTSGTIYYIDDSGYYTTYYSSKSPVYGVALSSDTMLLN
jgi:hypothetical protein